MQPSTVAIYAGMADKRERDPISEDMGRATVPMGRGFAWQRFNRGKELVWVEAMDGHMVGLTPWQVKVYGLAVEMVDHGTVKIRGMATILGCAPSTVSRALVRLMAWGLIGYLSGRGRYSGTVIFRMAKGDSLQRFRDAAKAKVRAWSQAAQRRLSRLQLNVAPYILDGDRGNDSLYKYLEHVTSTKGATLTRDWTAEDVAGVV